MSWNAEKQAAQVIPPLLGAVVAINCSTTVQVVDLTSIPRNVITPGTQPNDNPIGKYVRITADGGNIYWVTGNNFAALNAIANTVVFSTINTTTGKITVAGTEMDMLPSGAWKDFVAMAGVTPPAAPKTPAGNDSPCRYVALMSASGNPVARIHQSST
jgi:hypothetical protein